ncbi:Gfo/Idh/MocA family oxidoreductase [uncultured Ruegeria sp.]|uniref:Gfo/Idh/MocA family protein n=1 Tax=uncultured Ruegeria sp. TaxID=259304 RepID=UPI002619B136|nr:Gfo/Idh/MocA family oxidoreductase [uncultured Ruegeria sp.]
MKRILVAGGGLIGIRHVHAVIEHPGCMLVGLADPDGSIQIDAPRFASMDDVQDPVDGVIIATPTRLHTENGILAASRGWHMLIEKPVAASVNDALRLKRIVRQADVRSLVGHHRRYHSTLQHLKEVITQGTIGRVINVSLLWAMRKPNSYFEQNWRTSDGSPVMINLVHDVDVLRFVIGEISDVVALPGASIRGSDRIESGAVAIAFENGSTGTISFADSAPSPWGFEAGTGENPNIGTTRQDMMWITGTKGAVSFPSMTLWRGKDWGTAAQKDQLLRPKQKREPLEAQLDHFLDVIDGASPLIDVEDATRTLEVTSRIEQGLKARSARARAPT